MVSGLSPTLSGKKTKHMYLKLTNEVTPGFLIQPKILIQILGWQKTITVDMFYILLISIIDNQWSVFPNDV